MKYRDLPSVRVDPKEVVRDVAIVILAEVAVIAFVYPVTVEAAPLPNFVAWASFVFCGYFFRRKNGMDVARAVKHVFYVSVPICALQTVYVAVMQETLSIPLLLVMVVGLFWAGFSCMFIFGVIGSFFARQVT